MYIPWYAMVAPNRDRFARWINVEIVDALDIRAWSCFDCLLSAGAFQWPRVRCGSLDDLEVISIVLPVAESSNVIGG
jgi:hypothetical protein